MTVNKPTQGVIAESFYRETLDLDDMGRHCRGPGSALDFGIKRKISNYKYFLEKF